MGDGRKALKDWIDDGRRIVFFGGAGVSTESGIKDFRSADGLYSMQYKYPPEEILSHHFFMENPEEFFRFYRDKMVAPDAGPSGAHLALAELERQGKLTAVITQNIDGLHQKAGSKNVIELHGSVLRNTCVRCGKAYTLSDVLKTEGVPRCVCGGVIKPDVVLYEEALREEDLTAAVKALAGADLLIVGGTSLSVYPAAGLLHYFRGRRLALINRTETGFDDRAGLILRDKVGEVLFQAVFGDR